MNQPRGDTTPCKFCFTREVYGALCDKCKFYVSKGWIELRGKTYIKRGKFPSDKVASDAWTAKLKARSEKDRKRYVTKKFRLASL